MPVFERRSELHVCLIWATFLLGCLFTEACTQAAHFPPEPDIVMVTSAARCCKSPTAELTSGGNCIETFKAPRR